VKNYGLLIVGWLTIMQLTGQNYFPLVQENKDWKVMQVIQGMQDTTFYTITYLFEGDTLINNLNYLKVYKTTEENPVNWTLEGCIREDEDKKVFFHRYGVNRLKYDFGAQPGDTIDIMMINYPTKLIVEAIDSIYINDSFRKTIFLRYEESNDYEQWIEGIGSNRGILESGTAGYVGGWYWFLCMSENGELIYMNPDYNVCYLYTGLIDNSKPQLQIYPNPAQNILTIENKENVIIQSITLTNMNGQIIKQFVTDSAKLDISDINSGTYFLKICCEKGDLIKKIVIEK
jgi:hypothetical protein